jgi:prophage maintenance system killer protein
MKNDLVHFKDNEFELDVNVDKETIWLSQSQISELFEKDRSVITRHINNIFKEGELVKESNVQKMHISGFSKPTALYSLDVIISVGYRVKSPRGVLFRRWATNVLHQYLTEGYVINIKILERENEKLRRFQEMVSIVHRISLENDGTNDEIKNLLSVVKDYEYALNLLDQYDHNTVSIDGKVTQKEVQRVELDEIYEIIQEMTRDFDSDIFGKEKDSSLKGSLYNIYQTAFGDDVYPSIEEKASNLLYFLVKNHSFVDGNKRIAAAVFMYFIKKNDIYYTEIGAKRLSDNALVALTLLIAESKTQEREIIVKIIINLISEN